MLTAAVLATMLVPLPSSSALGVSAPSAGDVAAEVRLERVCQTSTHEVACGAIRQIRPSPRSVAPNDAGTVEPNALPSGYGPGDLRSAYNLTTGGSAATTVAVVAAYDNPSAESDLATYRSTYGLPPCRSTDGCFRKVNQRGDAGPLPAPDYNWAAEISLDLAMVSAICPGCRILLVEGDRPTLGSLGTAVNTAVAMGAKFVSNSYGAPEPSNAKDFDDAFYDHPGVVITASSGDSGYTGANYPASGRGVTAVGGTTLRRATSPRGWVETAWGGAGSGCSGYVARPDFQTGLATGCTRRAEVDVSAVADPQTGVSVYHTYTSSPATAGWQIYGGTSVSAPIIAAVYALAGDPGPTDSPNSYPYANTAGLNDVTTGSNGTCGAPMCTVGPGWDGPTGLGTPNGTAAFAANGLAYDSPRPAGEGFVAAGPTRVVDTRTGTGVPAGRVGPGGSVTVTMPSPPPGVSAVVLNLVATNLANAAATYVSACPAGQALASCAQTSSINPYAGVDIANQLTVPIGADGKVRLYNANGNVDLVADLAGYHTGGFVAAGPTRVVDTRTGTGVPAGRVGPGGSVTVTMPSPPPGVSAVVLNLVATNLANAAATYVSACPAGQALASCAQTSSINPYAGVDIANQLTVPIGADGKVRLYNANGNVDLVADLAGYHTGGFVAAGPTRVVDTRTGTGVPAGRVGPGGSVTVTMPSPPPGVSAVVLNLVATNLANAAATYVSACPAGQALASCAQTSSINPYAGVDIANQLTVPIGADGKVRLYNANGNVDLVADLAGYYTSS